MFSPNATVLTPEVFALHPHHMQVEIRQEAQAQNARVSGVRQEVPTAEWIINTYEFTFGGKTYESAYFLSSILMFISINRQHSSVRF